MGKLVAILRRAKVVPQQRIIIYFETLISTSQSNSHNMKRRLTKRKKKRKDISVKNHGRDFFDTLISIMLNFHLQLSFCYAEYI